MSGEVTFARKTDLNKVASEDRNNQKSSVSEKEIPSVVKRIIERNIQLQLCFLFFQKKKDEEHEA